MGEEQTENDTVKEGKNSQLSSIREKKNESDWIQRKNMLDWVGWAGGCGGIKYLQSKGLSKKHLRAIIVKDWQKHTLILV